MAKDTKERILMSALIHLCDREPEKTEEAIRKIEAFSRHFMATYSPV